jgi:hypothetical protein
MITEVTTTGMYETEKEVINLVVFNPTGFHFIQDAQFDETKRPMTWHWPEYTPPQQERPYVPMRQEDWPERMPFPKDVTLE